MITKHFLKTLIIFTGMIAIGLLGVFLSSYFDQKGKPLEAETPKAVKVAE